MFVAMSLPQSADLGITDPTARRQQRPHSGGERKRKDDRDRLPLHLVAADPDAPEALITALLEAFPQATNARDKAGWLPLHDAAHAGGPAHLYRATRAPPPRLIS